MYGENKDGKEILKTQFDKALSCSMCGRFLCWMRNINTESIDNDAVCNNCRVFITRRKKRLDKLTGDNQE